MAEEPINGEEMRFLVPIPDGKPIEVLINKKYRTVHVKGARSVTHSVPYSLDFDGKLAFGNEIDPFFLTGNVDVSTYSLNAEEVMVCVDIIKFMEEEKIKTFGWQTTDLRVFEDHGHEKSDEHHGVMAVQAETTIGNEGAEPAITRLKEAVIEY